MITEVEIRQAFEKAKEWIKTNIPALAIYVEEPTLEIVEVNDGWDIRRNISQRKIQVNLKRIRWYLTREKQFPHSIRKYDLETAFIHDLYEYCYLRKWNYPEDNSAINWIVHGRARILENILRRKKGLKDWI